MGKVTGFLEHRRIPDTYEPVDARLRHHREFVRELPVAQARVQAARCMDCGIPFCQNGCPVNNLIPDWNDLVYGDGWRAALEALHATNNFPEFTGRVCPAPCEAACTLNLVDEAVGIKSIERTIIDRGWQEGWVTPQPPAVRTDRRVAVVGSGPAGLAAAQQLARAGHAVTVFEKHERPGGLLRYGIPDFKLDKALIDRRLAQLEAEGVTFRTGVLVGEWGADLPAVPGEPQRVSAGELRAEYDAVLLAGGAEHPRDLPVPGRELAGVHFAMEFLTGQNRVNGGLWDTPPIHAEGKRVVVIGGGDTGSDCMGTSHRQGAVSVTQLELLPMPPAQEDKPLTWPYWPHRLRTSSSHEEGGEREFAVATKAFLGEGGRVTGVQTVRLDWEGGQMREVPGSEAVIPADLVLLAMGFVSPVGSVLQAFGVERDARGNASAATAGERRYATNVPGVFAAGDMRRGQSLVVWAIREGREAAQAVHEFLMG
ncbi:glutamate synthase [Deinococcus sp. RL]|uniref:glutamate synthase subunit beta n=1 Tax=Deinococcus sp. RL TaxID=1489678 RepID=UPI0004D543CA|nr:glutamate synthase subunit beta [Deinococcus sp. RL]KEF34718.1 glutamate synthase [Deinococcus sp. RL]